MAGELIKLPGHEQKMTGQVILMFVEKIKISGHKIEMSGHEMKRSIR